MAAGNGTIGDQSSCDVLGYQQATMVLVPVFYSLVFIFSLVGNVLVLVVICRGRQKLNSTAVYLLNLALSDCLFTLTLPGRIVYYILGFDWPFGDLLCRISTLLFFTNTYAGIGFMTCISLDRYLAVVHPQRLHCLRRVKMARWICCLVWALVSAQVAPVLFRNLLQHHEGRRTCMEYFDLNSSQWMPYFLILGCVISFCCPLAAILASYVSVHLKLRAAAERNPASRKNQRTNVIILLILITFIVCFSPYHLNVMQFMCRSIHHKVSCEELRGFKLSSQITVLLMNFNCCLDPIIYFFAIKTHKEMLSLFKDRLCPSSNATSSERAQNTSSNS